MVRFLLILAVIAANFFNLNAQENIIASAGGIKISAEEFRNRFDFMPHLNYSSVKSDSVKKEFLYSLVAEKLWALEAAEQGLDTLEAVRYSLQALKKLFIRDELYKKEIVDKIIIPGDELARGIKYSQRKLYLNFIVSEDSGEVKNIYTALKRGSSFDSVLRTRPEYKIQQSPVLLEFGKTANKNSEDIIFSLESGKFSSPVYADYKWFIYKIVKEDPDTDTEEQRRNKVFAILKEREERKLSGEFLDSLLGERKVTADAYLFNDMFEAVYNVVSAKQTDTSHVLSQDDILKSLRRFSQDKLKAVFISLDRNKYTLRDFLYYLMFQKVTFPSTEKIGIRTVLNNAVRNFIEDEIIVAEGIKNKLDRLPSVERDLKVWRDYYLSEIMMQKMADSVKTDDDAVRNFLSEKQGTDLLQVNIIEILVKEPADAEKVLNEIKAGIDFREIARKYNTRGLTKNTGGEWGYFPSGFNELGKIAGSMQTGEIYGPLKLPEGYSVFKLLDKKKINLKISPEDSLNLKPEVLREQLFLRKLDEIINRNTMRLAEKFKININEDLLGRTEVSGLNTYTYRLIGFGGRIAAFPVTVPVYDWYRMIKDKKEVP